MRTDGELLAAYAAGGSQAAFEELARRYGPAVYGVCLRILGDHHHAEEAAQAVFLTLAREAPKLRGSASISGWVFTAATHAAKFHARTRARRRKHEEEAARMRQSAVSGETREELAWADLAPHLDDALASLSEQHKRAVILRYLSGQSAAATAQLLGVHENTVTAWVNKGLAKLRSKLQSKGVRASAEALLLAIEQHAASCPEALL